MTALPHAPRRRHGWFAVAVALSAAALVWIGYRAVTQWQRAAVLVATRRAEAAVDLLVSALARDMRGAQLLVLESADRDGLTVGQPADLLHPIASAFARYPYPEVFFSWREPAAPAEVLFYTRPERCPPWLPPVDKSKPFPVVTAAGASVAQRLIARVAKDAWQARRFSIFDIEVGGLPYEVVALVSYGDRLRERPASALGFMVNLNWARQHYYTDLAAQVRLIEGKDRGVSFSIRDDRNQSVVGVPPERADAPARHRLFPATFFDSQIVAIDPPPDLRLPSWTAIASADADPTLAAAERGARWTMAVAIVMALTMTVGLLVSLRATRASTKLAEMRADFVSAVTHELKTPIANLRAINETLASGRSTLEMSREYAQLGIREANRLARLIDNLLAYSKVTDVAAVYSFEPVALGDVVARTLQEFASNLKEGAFEVRVDIPDDVPAVRADPTAVALLLSNVVDNAIRHAKGERRLRIAARRDNGSVTLQVSDRGVGIPRDELARVTRKFFRGRGADFGGSGLGLAIVERIVADHAGSLRIDSEVGRGTTVAVTLPAATT
jgi:signal transduction histidine kinase